MRSSFTDADWDDYAKWYERLNMLRPYTDMLDEVTKLLFAAGSNTPILDAGCGTGNLIPRLVQDGAAGVEITAIDSSRAMLERARQKCAGSGVTCMEADLNKKLPFPDSCFGRIACINALYALDDPQHALAEFSRVLSPKGVLVMVTPREGYENGLILKEHCGSTKPDEYWLKAHSSPEREEILVREAIRDEEVVRDMLMIAAHNRRIAGEQRFHFFTEAELTGKVEAAGFEIALTRPTYARQSILVVATVSR